MGAYDPVTVAGGFPSGGWVAAATICGPNGGNCVEVNLGVVGLAGLRDSKAAGPVLVFAEEKWGAFLTAAKSGLFDRA
jgi:hypothetical protein